MDIVFESQFYNAIYNDEFLLSKRFLHRAFEIALYSERYYEQINWYEIAQNVQMQKLLCYFKSMIRCINRVFYDTFPKTFLENIYSKKYEVRNDDINQLFCNYLVETETDEYKKYLGNFVTENWNGIAEFCLDQNMMAEFMVPYHHWIAETTQGHNEDFQCKCKICESESNISIYLRTFQCENYFSANGNFEDLETDGIHVFLYATQEFLYKSFFIFSKVNQQVVVMDSCNKRIAKEIDCKIVTYKNGYEIKIILNNEFLKKHNMEDEFFIGLIIAKCCSITGKRVRELTMSPNIEEWYSPTRFIKITRPL